MGLATPLVEGWEQHGSRGVAKLNKNDFNLSKIHFFLEHPDLWVTHFQYEKP
jgi:hypothetical protein